MSGIIGDLGAYLPADTTKAIEAKHSTNKRAGQELDMTDYLMLMITSLQNQTIDDTMSMSDMMNQMSTMSMMQAITNLNDVLSETSSMSYARSLLGEYVTVAVGTGASALQYYGQITGISVLNGEPIIFIGNDMFYLSDIIAIGQLPSADEVEAPGVGDDGDGDGEEDGDGNGIGDGIGNGNGDGGDENGNESNTISYGGGVKADGGTGTYYGYSYNPNDFEYVQDANGAIRIVYKGEDGASAMGVTEQMIPGGTAVASPSVAAAAGTEAEQSATQEQRSAVVEADEESEEAEETEPARTFAETEVQQDMTPEQSTAGAEAAMAEWLAENS